MSGSFYHLVSAVMEEGLTMERCICSHAFCWTAPGFCEYALPGFDTRFYHLVAQHCTSLWDTEHQDGSPDHRPRAELQLDSVRFAVALLKQSGAMGSSTMHISEFDLAYIARCMKPFIKLYSLAFNI